MGRYCLWRSQHLKDVIVNRDVFPLADGLNHKDSPNVLDLIDAKKVDNINKKINK